MSHGNFPIKRLLQYLPKNMNRTVWDLGCGRGEVAYYIKAFRGLSPFNYTGEPRIMGFDLNFSNVEWCQKSGVYVSAYHEDLINFSDWKDNYQKPSLVILSHVLEHIPEGYAMKLAKEVCETSPNILLASPYKEKKLGLTHFWAPNEKTVEELRRMGLNVEVQPHSSLMNADGPTSLLLRTYDLLFKLPRELIAWR